MLIRSSGCGGHPANGSRDQRADGSKGNEISQWGGTTMRKALVLVVATVLVATACQSGQQAPSSGPTLTVAMSGDIETIDPMFSHFTRSNEVNYNIYDQFFRYDMKPGAGGV